MQGGWAWQLGASLTCLPRLLSARAACRLPHPPQDCPLPYSNYGHVILGRPSPVLFYPISSTEVGAGQKLAAFCGWWAGGG
jgi:hypothetical protein